MDDANCGLVCCSPGCGRSVVAIGCAPGGCMAGGSDAFVVRHPLFLWADGSPPPECGCCTLEFTASGRSCCVCGVDHRSACLDAAGCPLAKFGHEYGPYCARSLRFTQPTKRSCCS